MKTKILSIAFAMLILSGCGKMYSVFHGKVPSSIKVERMDMTGAAALAVMPYAGATKALTKAGEDDYEDRLFIVSEDGQTKLASFTFSEQGAKNNTLWQEIRKTLTLVPTEIVPITQDLILLSEVKPVTGEWHADGGRRQ